MFDISILPLSSPEKAEGFAGQSHFFAAQTAKKVARQRRRDTLLLHLSLQGKSTLSADKQALLLQRLSEVFYKTPGTTTGALRAVAESLNQFLFERNARLDNPENQVVAFLTQMVFGQGRLTIAQSGLSHVYWISSGGVEHLYDPDLAGQGLGVSKVAKIRFVQVQIQSEDSLLVCVKPAASWSSALLASLYGKDLKGLHQKLVGETASEAWALQFKAGSGKIIRLPVTAVPLAQDVQPSRTSAASATQAQTSSPSPLADLEANLSVDSPASPSPHQEQPSPPIPGKPFSASQASPAVEMPEPAEPPSPPLTDIHQRQPSSGSASLLDGFRNSLQGAGARFVRWLSRLLPDSSVFQIPTALMALIAILTPLLVVTVASLVYFRQGQVAEFERYLALAEQAAQQAQTLQDPLAQRSAWQTTLAYLDRATSYSNSSEAQALRAQANAAIDQLEAIQRLDFAVAMDDLPKEAQIVKMAVTENELFLLDANAGVVWRATAAARGYVLNPNASCGPGIQGAAVGKLVGFGIIRKPTQLQAVIVGLDSKGNVVTCDYYDPPMVAALTPDERGMGSLRGFLIDGGNSYVLDPEKNAVWIYWKNKYSEKPELFFSEDVPPMDNIVDFAVYGQDLYLLYADGHLAQCSYSSSTPTRCVDPQPYKDSRPGRENQPLQSETPFTRLFVSQPPEPALYLLESSQPAIYQFSLRLLAFHTQFRSIPTPSFSPLPQGVPASALAVSSEQRLVFLAFGNRLYYANLP
ncbi:MAG: hypothetical protein DDG59_05035 [Anaerolineae bacterium]|nr:MAG: hypothetical protein DDG59_05035 [Anaerolineae bacterium]